LSLGSGIRRTEGRRGFTYPEMIFLLVTLAVFLGGTVWVVSGAIVKSHPFGQSEGAGKHAQVAMNKIEVMVKAARQFYYDPGSSKVPVGVTLKTDNLDFLADLDSDASTGSYSVGTVKGLERVQVVRQGVSLVVFVRSGPTSAPERVVLTRDLAPGDPGAYGVAFAVKHLGEALSTSKVHVSITTGARGSRLVVARDITLSRPTPLAVSP
jgi:hypothetical protein